MKIIKRKLKEAKALIDTPEKWGKGDGGRSPKFRLCALDACAIVGLNGRPTLNPFLPNGHDEVHTYNDHPDTTHKDMMDLFDRAINAKKGDRSIFITGWFDEEYEKNINRLCLE